MIVPEMDYKLRIAVCDDDEVDRKAIGKMVKAYVEKHSLPIRVDELSSGEKLLYRSADYDLAVLDIYMKELNGIETAERLLEENQKIQLILCSNSNDFAAESYDLSVIRYLLKPVQEEKLVQALERFFKMHAPMQSLKFRQNRREESVYVSEILWVEADNHRSIIHTCGEDLVTTTRFQQICEQLNGNGFVKPIRYALVSLDAIAAIPSDVLKLRDGTEVPVSRDLRAEMKKVFMEYKMRTLREGDWE